LWLRERYKLSKGEKIMSTETSTETETQTSSVTRTRGACALGAGAAAITCKAAFLGFLGSFAALAGLSAIGDLALTIGVFILAIPLIWRGFRWAGRKPAFLATGGLGLMWLGYTLAGVLVTGRGMFGAGMMPASSIVSNPLGLIPVGIAYIGGTALFGWGAYDSFGKELEISKGGLGAGIAGASICGGCGITGLAGAAAVLLTGVSTNSMKFVGADLAMLLGVGGVLAVTLYKRAWIQSATVVAGGFVALVLFGMGMFGMGGFITLPDTAVGEILSTLITFVGLAMVFFGLVWAYYPQMRILPEDWTPLASVRNRA
jgi:hypothetical protein